MGRKLRDDIYNPNHNLKLSDLHAWVFPQKETAAVILFIEEIEAHGTVELWTERMVLRRYCPEDAEPLYRRLRTDPETARYSGWIPYATLEMAKDTVPRFIDGYDDAHVYAWVMDVDDVVIGTIGAYDYKDDRIDVGFGVVRGWQGLGYATDSRAVEGIDGRVKEESCIEISG